MSVTLVLLFAIGGVVLLVAALVGLIVFLVTRQGGGRNSE
jgi:hypothetical protein